MREYARLRMLQVFRAMTNLFLAFMMMLGTPRRMVLKPAKKRNWQIRRIRSTRVHALHAPRTAAKRAIFSEDSAQLFLCVVVSVGLFVPRLLRFLSDQTWGHTVLLLGQVIATLLVLWLSVQVIMPLPCRPRMHPNARGPMQCALPNAMQCNAAMVPSVALYRRRSTAPLAGAPLSSHVSSHVSSHPLFPPLSPLSHLLSAQVHRAFGWRSFSQLRARQIGLRAHHALQLLHALLEWSSCVWVLLLLGMLLGAPKLDVVGDDGDGGNGNTTTSVDDDLDHGGDAASGDAAAAAATTDGSGYWGHRELGTWSYQLLGVDALWILVVHRWFDQFEGFMRLLALLHVPGVLTPAQQAAVLNRSNGRSGRSNGSGRSSSAGGRPSTLPGMPAHGLLKARPWLKRAVWSALLVVGAAAPCWLLTFFVARGVESELSRMTNADSDGRIFWLVAFLYATLRCAALYAVRAVWLQRFSIIQLQQYQHRRARHGAASRHGHPLNGTGGMSAEEFEEQSMRRVRLPPRVRRYVRDEAQEEALFFCCAGTKLMVVREGASHHMSTQRVRARHDERFFQLSQVVLPLPPSAAPFGCVCPPRRMGASPSSLLPPCSLPQDMSTLRWSWTDYLLIDEVIDVRYDANKPNVFIIHYAPIYSQQTDLTLTLVRHAWYK